jgi:Zn-dependent protease
MAVISVIEIIRIIITTAALGYIFSAFIPKKSIYGIYKSISMDDIKLAALIAAPAVILHEMAHKFVAIAFGIHAEFFASYTGLALGVILKMFGSPFLVFIPGYVMISSANIIQSGIISFAGPFTNLLLWLFATLMLQYYHKLKNKHMLILALTKKINGILFLFNMIPFGFFDGAKVFSAVRFILGI